MSLYEEITNRILSQLEAGTAPWVKPWAMPLPYNAATQHRYSGVNVLLLWDAPFARPAWITFKQAATLGGRVIAGSHATRVVYVSKVTKADGGEEEVIAFLRQYHVFNVEQVEGLPENLYAPPVSLGTGNVNEFFAAVPADVRHGSPHAYYTPVNDYIRLPHPEHFTKREKYYATRLHETVHWTGHASRLDRLSNARFGDSAYAFEELVAELGSAFLSSSLGLTPELHHAEYLASWVTLLKDHRKAIVSAAARASAAADYLWAFSATHEEPHVLKS